MARLTVAPRNTPAERASERITVEVDEDLSVYASTFEEWVTPRQAWALALREGTDLGRANNVEVELEFAAGEQTSLLQFRLDQLDAATETGEELVLQFEERDGTARLARLSQTGLYVELFHVLTFT